MPRPPVFVCWLPKVPLASVVRSVSTNGVIETMCSGTPTDSAAIIDISDRSPGPMSLAAETHWTVPSELTITWPLAGLPPAPWLHACAAMPMPWKTPGRISLAFGACQFCFQPIRSAVCVRQSRIPGLLNGRLVSGLPSSLMFCSRNSTGSLLIAYAALSINTSSAKVPLGWLTQRYEPDLYELVKTSTASSFRFWNLYRSWKMNHEPLAAAARWAPTLAMILNEPETSDPSRLSDILTSSRNCGRCWRTTKSSARV